MKSNPAKREAGRSPVRVAVISFFILVLELALIRLIPSEIKAISYFTNLLLFSSFFGLGLGCILWKRELPGFLFPAGLFLIFAFLMVSRGITVYDTGEVVHYWLQRADANYKPFWQMPLVLAALTAFLVSAIPFITMGWTLSREMQGHPRLTAYAYDLLGSFLGVVFFAFVSYLECPPWILITVTAVTWALVFHGDWRVRVLFYAGGAAYLCFMVEPHSWRWSPYYFIQYQVDLTPDSIGLSQPPTVNRVTIWVNSSFHQEAINFKTTSPDFIDTARLMAQKFSFPYQIYRKNHNGQLPRKLLILGAGSGNDAYIALLNGVPDITAVEIDPEIANIGREFNPLRPYQSPNVKLVIDDGRHFLWNAKTQYDMVIFGTLDSQTLLSGQTDLRLDNYIYTTQCFEDVKKILKPGGMLATYYSTTKPWFYTRIYSTVASAFPQSLRMYMTKDSYLFNTIIMAAKDDPGFVSDPEIDSTYNTAMPSSDDWPYIYLQFPTISKLYLEVFALIGALIALIFLLLRRLEKSTQLHLDFFFLGVGFSLMESAAVVRLALAFGTTWVVSAVVFASVLLTVFLANCLLVLKPNIPIRFAWISLLACLGINFFFPVQTLLALSFPLRLLGAALLIGAPVFFAGIIFSKLFSREPEVGFPFGMNMIGAMTGGSIEYLSMLIGMKNIWLVLLGIYFLAHWCHRCKKIAAAV